MSFWRGGDTLRVSAKLFVENRQRLLSALQLIQSLSGSVVVLQGGVEKGRYNTDADDLPLRQESYFFWATGVHESDCFAALDVDSGRTILFPPKLPADFAIWQGKIEPVEWFKEKYEVEEAVFHTSSNGGTEIADRIKQLKSERILLLRAFNTDSGEWLEPAKFPGMENFSIDTTTLYPVMAELRVLKTDKELEVLRYASKIASAAHMEVMRKVHPNMYEYQMESLFRHISYSTGGCRHLGYTCIAPSGANTAVLHYGGVSSPNAKLINDGDMCLFDMGPEYNCYISDVTCSFPANGKFTPRQRIVYTAVYKANQAVFEAAKPGVRWTDMHMLAERVILTELKEVAGILVGDVDEMVKKRLGAVFMPHGLGHFMGLDTHDVGGYMGDAEPRSKLPGLKSLRTTRTLKERMVITIEPGCYFIDTLLDKALNDSELSSFFVADKLKEYRGIGGVRIEDDVVIWERGNENMNHQLPRTADEIEAFMAKAAAEKAAAASGDAVCRRVNAGENCQFASDGKNGTGEEGKQK